MRPTGTPATCLHCGNELDQHKGRGRPPLYCGHPCRQASYRERERLKKAARARPAPPRTNDGDDTKDPSPGSIEEQLLLQLALDVQEDLRHLVRLLSPGPRPSAVELVQTSELVRSRVSAMASGLVLNARRRRITWDVLADVLGLSPETARRSYHERLIERQLAQHIPPTPAPVPDKADDEAPAPPPLHTSRRASSRLAPVLSELQRASGMPLRQLGLRSRVSASYLSRVMSGEVFPTLPLTERIGQALGADIQLLHTIWTGERDRKNTAASSSAQPASAAPTAAADQLRTALRTLQRRSMMPTPQRIAATTGGLVSERDIEGIFRGEQIGTWSQIQHLVQALDGEPAFFHPLWERAAYEARAAGPTPADSPEHRVTRLLTAFGRTLSTSETGGTRAASPRQPQRRATRAQVLRNRIALTAGTI